jgi:hypothetical protein
MKFKPLYNPSVMTFSMVVPDMKPSTGIQKICGFTRGLSFHRVKYFPYWHISNSIVLGCNRDTETSQVRLFMYAYVNGKLIDPKECVLGLFDAGVKITPMLTWTKYVCRAEIIQDGHWVAGIHKFVEPTLPVGWLLNNYAEIDNTNNKTPFHCQVEDLRVNGRKI